MTSTLTKPAKTDRWVVTLGVQVVSTALSGGTLLGRLIPFLTVNDGNLPFDLKLGGQTVRAVFYRHNGSTRLINTYAVEETTITFSIPSIGDLPPRTAVIPGMWEMNIDSMLQSAALLDNSRFFLTVCAQSPASPADRIVFAAEAYRRNLPFGGGEYHPIGSYLQARLGTDRVFLQAIHSACLLEVLSVELRNSSDTGVLLTDAPVLPTGGELFLPCRFLQGGLADINVVCTMSVPKVEIPLAQKLFNRQQNKFGRW